MGNANERIVQDNLACVPVKEGHRNKRNKVKNPREYYNLHEALRHDKRDSFPARLERNLSDFENKNYNLKNGHIAKQKTNDPTVLETDHLANQISYQDSRKGHNIRQKHYRSRFIETSLSSKNGNYNLRKQSINLHEIEATQINDVITMPTNHKSSDDVVQPDVPFAQIENSFEFKDYQIKSKQNNYSLFEDQEPSNSIQFENIREKNNLSMMNDDYENSSFDNFIEREHNFNPIRENSSQYYADEDEQRNISAFFSDDSSDQSISLNSVDDDEQRKILSFFSDDRFDLNNSANYFDDDEQRNISSFFSDDPINHNTSFNYLDDDEQNNNSSFFTDDPLNQNYSLNHLDEIEQRELSRYIYDDPTDRRYIDSTYDFEPAQFKSFIDEENGYLLNNIRKDLQDILSTTGSGHPSYFDAFAYFR